MLVAHALALWLLEIEHFIALYVLLVGFGLIHISIFHIDTLVRCYMISMCTGCTIDLRLSCP